MRTILADTGPLYALKDPDDQFHERAQEDSLRVQRDHLEVAIAWTTMLETYNLILRRLMLQDAQEWVNETTVAARLINPALHDYQQAFERCRRYPDQTITPFDALAAVLSERLDIPVWTYDYHFDVMGTNVWR